MPIVLNRRALLRAAVATSAGLVAAPALRSLPAAADAPAAFVTDYQTNVSANLTADTNAAVRILSGMQRLWHTGTTWDTGRVLAPEVLRASMRYVTRITRSRTPAQAARAFIQDRQHQSYAVITGLGPLADAYRTGALAVTSIVTAPAGTPATKIDDAVPAGAPAGSAIGAGSPDSPLGAVVTLVNTLRGPYASGNPSKYAYEYPRPWRMTADSKVVDTGVLDAFGFPVYDSEVVVAPQLLRQRSLSPVDDAGFPSGHTNAFHLAALALAYAVPERFQELVTAAIDLSDTRIVAGMHSPVDVIGGRILATALAAATLADPANAELKVQAHAQAKAYFAAVAVTASHDAYADRRANRRLVEPKLTYGLPRRGPDAAMVVPAGAEVLLETRLPYLDAAQRREVLRTTAIGGGWPLLDGPESWGRLDLFAAADGYGRFDRDVTVALDSAAGGLGAADVWRNDIDGRGGLIKRGTGALQLTGANRYRGGTTVADGTLTVGSVTALGDGDVLVTGGVLDVAVPGVRVRGEYRQPAGVLSATVRAGHGPAVTATGDATIGPDAVLRLDVHRSCAHGVLIPVLGARRIRGRFARVVVGTTGYRAELVHTRTTVFVRIGS